MYKNMLFGCYNSQEIYFKKNIANETYDNKVHNNLKNYTKNKTRKIISTPWTQEEDELLEEKYKQYGNKFSLILKFFPNKTKSSIKNRVNFINKLKIKNIYEEDQKYKINEDNELETYNILEDLFEMDNEQIQFINNLRKLSELSNSHP